VLSLVDGDWGSLGEGAACIGDEKGDLETGDGIDGAVVWPIGGGHGGGTHGGTCNGGRYDGSGAWKRLSSR